MADAFDDVLRFLWREAFGQGHRWYDDVGQAIGVVADAAGEVDVAETMAGVVVLADAVFLHAGAVVDVVEQMGLGEEGECAEDGGAVEGGQAGFKVGEAEGIAEVVPDFPPDEQPVGGEADACLLKYLFVGL